MMNCHEEDDEKANFVPFSSIEKAFFCKIEKQMTTMKKKNEKNEKNSKMKIAHKEGMAFFSH